MQNKNVLVDSMRAQPVPFIPMEKQVQHGNQLSQYMKATVNMMDSQGHVPAHAYFKNFQSVDASRVE